jgi:cytochrome c oxidase assembly protein subunit 15
MRLPRLSPSAYRRVTAVAVLALAFIVVTGGAVRLTGSGLGCPDWPTCHEDRLVAPLEYHAMVEFVNRTVTGLVSAAVVLAVLGSLVREPRRRDLTRWSLGLVAGVVAQIVLGGLTVLFELAPPFVIGHFLLSMVLVWNAVVLHHLAGEPEGRPRPLLGGGGQEAAARLVPVAAALVLVTGTVVTGSGPHGGDEEVRRLPFFLPDVARVHGGAVVAFCALLLAVLVRLHRAGAPPDLLKRGRVLLAVAVAQAAVGYVQYFTGVPVLLVGVHVAGATAVWAAAVRFDLGLRTRRPAGAAAPPAPGAARTLARA